MVQDNLALISRITAPIIEKIPKFNERKANRLSIFFFLAMLIFLAIYAWAKPAFNWDFVPYVAVAHEQNFESAQELHTYTWKLIEAEAPAGQLYILKFGNPYNLYQWENPEGFKSQLSMFRVKVAYVWLIQLIEPFLGVLKTVMALSIVPALLFGGLCLFYLKSHNAVQGIVFLTPILLVADYFYMTITATPDMLLALLSVAAIVAYSRKKEWLGAALLFASLAVRPDNIILIFAFLIAAFLFNWKRLPITLSFILGLVLCLWIARFGEHPGWWRHFWFSCIELQNDMRGFDPEFSIITLLKGYFRGISVAFRFNDWIALYLALHAAWLLLWRMGRCKDLRTNGLLFALSIGLLGKFVSFPLPDDRFYFVFISGMALILVGCWKPRLDITATLPKI